MLFGDIMSENNEKKGRIFNLLLYPDNPKHALAIMELQTKDYLACGICHDMDCYEEDTETHKAGELKKKHFHFVVKFPNPRYKSGVAKSLDIEERFVDVTKNFKQSARYLLHFGDDDKYQYEPDKLVGRLKPDVLKLLEDKPSETQQASLIADYIASYDGILKKTDLFYWCCNNGFYSSYRRGYSLFLDLLYEHNEPYFRYEVNKRS